MLIERYNHSIGTSRVVVPQQVDPLNKMFTPTSARHCQVPIETLRRVDEEFDGNEMKKFINIFRISDGVCKALCLESQRNS